MKVGAGKLHLHRPLHRLFADLVTEQGVEVLPVDQLHCTLVASLPLHHRDPFDRMLIAQAQQEKVPILTADSKIDAYEVVVLW